MSFDFCIGWMDPTARIGELGSDVSDVSVDAIKERPPERISLISTYAIDVANSDVGTSVSIVDRTLSDRCGVRGSAAAGWLESLSMLVPDKLVD